MTSQPWKRNACGGERVKWPLPPERATMHRRLRFESQIGVLIGYCCLAWVFLAGSRWCSWYVMRGRLPRYETMYLHDNRPLCPLVSSVFARWFCKRKRLQWYANVTVYYGELSVSLNLMLGTRMKLGCCSFWQVMMPQTGSKGKAYSQLPKIGEFLIQVQ